MAASAQQETGKKQAWRPGSQAVAAQEGRQSKTGRGSYADLLALQSTAGNRAAGRLLSSHGSSGALPPGARQGLDSSATALDPDTRTEMEDRFGYDFGPVRLHLDAAAARSAGALQARAFTVGRDIVFGSGQYAMGSPQGKLLLAHELAHTIQQSRGGAAPPTNLPGSPLEQDAGQAAEAAVQGSGPVQVTGASAPGPALQPVSERQIEESVPTSQDFYTGEQPQSSLDPYGESQTEEPVPTSQDYYIGELPQSSMDPYGESLAEEEAVPTSQDYYTGEQPQSTPGLAGESETEDPEQIARDVIGALESIRNSGDPGMLLMEYQGQPYKIEDRQYQEMRSQMSALVRGRINVLTDNYNWITQYYTNILEVNESHRILSGTAEWFSGVGRPGDDLTTQFVLAKLNLDEAEAALATNDFSIALDRLMECANAQMEAARLIEGYTSGLFSGTETMKSWALAARDFFLAADVVLISIMLTPAAGAIATEVLGLSGASATLATGAMVTGGGTLAGAEMRARTHIAGKMLTGELPKPEEVLAEYAAGAKFAFPLALGVGTTGATAGLLSPLTSPMGNLVRVGTAGYAGGAYSSLAQGLLEGKSLDEATRNAQLMGLTGMFGGMLGAKLSPLTSRFGMGAYMLGEGIIGFGTGGAGAYLTGGPVLQSAFTSGLQSAFLSPAGAPQLSVPGKAPLLGGTPEGALGAGTPPRVSWRPSLPWGERLALTGSSQRPSLIPGEGPPFALGRGLAGETPEWASPLAFNPNEPATPWLNMPVLPEPGLTVTGKRAPVLPAEQLAVPGQPARAAAPPPPPARPDPRSRPKFWKKVRGGSRLDLTVQKLKDRKDLIPGDPMEYIKTTSPTDVADAIKYVNDLHDLVTEVGKAVKQGVDTPNVSKILEGLTSENPKVRQAARFMLERGRSNRKELKSVQDADAILERFSLEDVQQIRDLYPAETNPDIPDKDVFSALNTVTRNINGDAAEIQNLIDQAGSGATPDAPNPDLFRLQGILNAMGPGRHQPSVVFAAIQRQNQRMAALSSLSDDFVNEMFDNLGVGVIPKDPDGGRLLSKVPTFVVGGKLSGSIILSHFRDENLVNGLVEQLTKGSPEANDASFVKLQDVILDSDIPQHAANNLIGYYWERAWLDPRVARQEPVYDQTNIKILGTNLSSDADAIVVDHIDLAANTVYIDVVEHKTGQAGAKEKLRPAQKEIRSRVTENPGAEHSDLEVSLPPEVRAQLDPNRPVRVIINRYIINPAPLPSKKRK